MNPNFFNASALISTSFRLSIGYIAPRNSPLALLGAASGGKAMTEATPF